MHEVLIDLRLVFYRFHDKGLEIFLVKEDDQWKIPSGQGSSTTKRFFNRDGKLIELEANQVDQIKNLAIEADWHDMPSIRGLIKHDLKMVEGKIQELEHGTYVAAKEAFKKVLPHEYAVIKELKDILFDRNLIKNI
ncbi:MAG: hypothetical protein KA109_05560 [Saprospiraceae bacterium]|jgi:hypothetical protein|nr:hypothetical protein [Saprospiraceae bacterium]MBK6476968.1 hypothetical protein [Saprospiraceae bacterium]MBK6814734.1 hypothetical protein [Saprospiraceae bacterium]MBK7370124.1 hypothetical protein [Saprospiraceae bacterium]MBK7437828.1 hypothetical protein [Saprospiraceae bacterium]